MQTRLRNSALALAALACLCAAPVRAATDAQRPELVRVARDTPLPTDRLIVKYRDAAAAATPQAQAAIQVAANRQGVQLRLLREMSGGAQVFRLNRRLAHEEVQILADNLRAGDAGIEYAEPDRLLQALYVPNDAMYARQWALSDTVAGIRAPAAWDKARGTGVVVAVVDTGVRPHADLAANLVAGYDFITDAFVANDGAGRDGDAADPGDAVTAGYCGSGSPASNSSWHGTHVAGIIAAVGGNGTGVAGVAFGAKVQPVRALGRCGGYLSDIADAITWAAGSSVAGVPANPTPARVINLSLGGSGSCATSTQNAINAARAKGAVVVVAAGNSNADASTATPANCAGVVTVAATGPTGGKASYSNTGANVALAAPGGDSAGGILSTLNAGTTTPGADAYVSYAGTSMATPHVAAVAALMLSVNKSLTPDQVGSLLKSSARAFPAACARCGTGIVDASAAVNAALAAAAPAPAPTPAPAPAPAPSTIAEIEPNDSFALAQPMPAAPATLRGSLASNTDGDHYRVSIAAGKRVVATLTAASTLGLNFTALVSATQPLVQLVGSAGQSLALTISNSGSAPVTVVFRVQRSTGTIGAYQLALAP